MKHWVMAFVGNHARENHGITQRTNAFCVSSNRTPIREATPGDRVLLYLVGRGFVGSAVIPSSAESPDDVQEWYSKDLPMWRISVEDLRPFPRPIPYEFHGDGNHPVLGFHRFSLTHGFLAIPETGFDDVMQRSGAKTPAAPKAAAPTRPAEAPATRKGPMPAVTSPKPRPSVAAHPEREKRAAGLHALSRGRKGVAAWTVVEVLASALKLRGIERSARNKVRVAEKTWLAGGRAEERVGEELEALRVHGFYVFHDVPFTGIGNVDHVVLGEKGFFSIEMKSHAGRVTARGGELLRNGRPFEKDFIKQAWSGCYRLRETLGADVTPLLLFTDAFVEGRITARGVRVLPLRWVTGEILKSGSRHDPGAVKAAVAKLSSATGCHPSAAPRLA